MIDLNFEGVKGLHLIGINMRSLYSAGKFDMFSQQVRDSKAHVFCLSETWLKIEFPHRGRYPRLHLAQMG